MGAYSAVSELVLVVSGSDNFGGLSSSYCRRDCLRSFLGLSGVGCREFLLSGNKEFLRPGMDCSDAAGMEFPLYCNMEFLLSDVEASDVGRIEFVLSGNMEFRLCGYNSGCGDGASGTRESRV